MYRTLFFSKSILLLLFLAFHNFFGQTTITQTITATGAGTWTVPCGVTSVTISAWGGGGAGGGEILNNAKGGGGGAGGAKVRATISVTPGTTINYSVGSGATGATSAGAAGGDTWFINNLTLLAKGGAGGAAPNGGTVLGGVGTTAGSISPSGGTITAGVSGGNGTSSNTGAGGAGGATGGGAGGTGALNSGGNGNAGSQPGGGGGGAFVNNNANRSGGSGGNGQIIITYTYPYCVKNFTTSILAITNVTFSGINNTTSNTSTTANESFCLTANLLQSQTYSISLKGDTGGNFTHYFTVYVDWDQNGVFGNAANEIYSIGTITNSTGIDAKVLNGSITVPATATIGTTKMRVISNYNAYTTDPCNNDSYGQAEDYIVTVAATPPCSAPTNPPTNLVFGTTTSTSIAGSFTASIPASDNYIVVRSTSSSLGVSPVDGTTYSIGNTIGSGTVISVGNTTSFTDTGLTPGTLYYYFVFPYNNVLCIGGTKYLTSSVLSNSQTTNCSTITALTLNNVSFTSALVSWTGTTDAVLGYDYYLSTSAISPTGSTTPTGSFAAGTTSYLLTGLTPGTTYYLWIRSKCTSSTSSSWVGINFTTFSNATCSTPTSGSVTNYYISDVKFLGTLIPDTDNTTTNLTGGYKDYSTLGVMAKQIPGGGINVYVKGPNSVLTWFKAWVDWNNDGSFDENTERVYFSYDVPSSTTIAIYSTTFGFVVPIGTAPGNYKIRIRNYYNYPADQNNPYNFKSCGNLINGETEDYTFQVISDCSANIASVINGLGCGTGSVAISAAGNAGTTSYQWYTSEYGATAISGANSATYNTPAISSTTTYYVTALDGTCESVKRTPVVAKINPVPTLTINASNPNLCGDEDSVILTATGSVEEKTLLSEDFERGFLNFTMSNIISNGATIDAKTQWQIQPSTYIPTNEVWFPAISSGLGTNKFAYATSDISGYWYNTALTTTNTLDSTGLQNLKLDFSMYFSFYGDGDVVYIEVSTNGGTTWTTAQSYTSSIGIGTRFNKITLDLTPYINQANLKIRFRYYSYWADGVAIDNIRVYGDKPISPNFSWSIPNMNIYSFDCITPYSGAASSVCIKPNTTQVENYPSWNINASVNVSNGCSAYGVATITNISKVWNTNTSTNWTDLKWLPNNSVPTASSCIIIKQPVFISSGTNGLGKNMKIYNGGKLTINSGASLTITDFIKNYTSTSTDFTVQSDASLIQVNDGAAITGNATVLRNLNISSGRQEYNYLSSPVAGQNIRGIYPGVAFSPTNLSYPRAVYYNETNDYFYNSSGAYIAGRGLALKEPSTADIPSSSVNLTYTGVPYNTPATFLNFPLAWTNNLHGYNLVGNPFPSNIDLNKVFTASSNIESTFRFWDNSVNNIYVQQGSLYAGYCYAVYNALAGSSGTGIPAPGFGAVSPGGNGMPVGTKVPNNIVKVGQGFIVRSKASGAQIVFKNSERLYDNTGAQFYQKGNSSKADEDDAYYLILRGPNNINIPNAIVYFAGGSNTFGDEDSLLDATPSDALYSYAGTSKVLINGRSGFVVTDAVDLGTSYSAAGSYTISIGNKKGIFANGQEVYLHDKVLNTYTNLQNAPYTINVSAKGQETGRFEIVYQNPSGGTLGATGATKSQSLLVYRNGDQFVAKSENKAITGIEVFDASGRLVKNVKSSSTTVSINANDLQTGTYILKISTEDDIVTKKVFK